MEGLDRFRAIATDYDGTVATAGRIDDAAVESLRRFRLSGRKTLLVTGRRVEDLKTVFPYDDLFDLWVAENGALLYWPQENRFEPLAESPPPKLVETLIGRGAPPLAVGRIVIAMLEPQLAIAEAVVRELGLAISPILNKGNLMLLPEGIDKASGLLAALPKLGLDAELTIGIGDAENDLCLLDACGLGVAVDNALPLLKAGADIVTLGARGTGVAEIVEAVLSADKVRHDN